MTTSGCKKCGGSFHGPTLAESRWGMCETCLTAWRNEMANERASATPAARPHPAVRPCARCGFEVLVRCGFMDRAPAPDEASEARAAPLAIAFRPRVVRPLFGKEHVDHGTHDYGAPVGVLEGYFCRACGLVEWFVQNPGEVPIGTEYGTELVDLRGNGPYR